MCNKNRKLRITNKQGPSGLQKGYRHKTRKRPIGVGKRKILSEFTEASPEKKISPSNKTHHRRLSIWNAYISFMNVLCNTSAQTNPFYFHLSGVLTTAYIYFTNTKTVFLKKFSTNFAHSYTAQSHHLQGSLITFKYLEYTVGAIKDLSFFFLIRIWDLILALLREEWLVLPLTSVSTTPPKRMARFLCTHIENPALGPGGIPSFLT